MSSNRKAEKFIKKDALALDAINDFPNRTEQPKDVERKTKELMDDNIRGIL